MGNNGRNFGQNLSHQTSCINISAGRQADLRAGGQEQGLVAQLVCKNDLSAISGWFLTFLFNQVLPLSRLLFLGRVKISHSCLKFLELENYRNFNVKREIQDKNKMRGERIKEIEIRVITTNCALKSFWFSQNFENKYPFPDCEIGNTNVSFSFSKIIVFKFVL